ncbi:MAG TPA: hypothetical protein VGV06_06680 [Methylomirabilota bacterium]|nr:hypothetical protein [Methylomirabilota bacterium]
MANEPPDEVQRRTAKQQVALGVSILNGETSVQQAARPHRLTGAEIEELVLDFDNRSASRPNGRG